MNTSPPTDDNSSTQWFYIGSDGNEYGPYNAGAMLEWSKSGYFSQDSDVALRTINDSRAYPLFEWMSACNGLSPFLFSIHSMNALLQGAGNSHLFQRRQYIQQHPLMPPQQQTMRLQYQQPPMMQPPSSFPPPRMANGIPYMMPPPNMEPPLTQRMVTYQQQQPAPVYISLKDMGTQTEPLLISSTAIEKIFSELFGGLQLKVVIEPEPIELEADED